ncbi:MAG TPA: ester cyclase [bacterium]|nr:ester cyclase [bacterium]
MKRSQILILTAVLVGFGFVQSASAAVTAVRTLPCEEYWPNQREQVTIEVTGDPGPITVVETPPAGWDIIGISPRTGMSFTNGILTWDFLTFDGSQTFSYQATPPEDAEGEVVFSGRIGIQPIAGMTIQSLATLKPLGIFEDHRDIVDNLQWPGIGSYDPETGEYMLYGTGDYGHVAYTKLSGDFTLKTRVTGRNSCTPEPACFGVLDELKYMSSQEIPYYSVVLNSGGFAKAMWSTGTGGNVSPWTMRNLCDGRYMIARRGNTMSMYYFDTSLQMWKQHHTTQMIFTDPVYVVLLAPSLSLGCYSTVNYSEVELLVSEDEIRTVVEQSLPDALNTHDLDQALSYFATDVVYDFTPQPPVMQGTEQVAAFFGSLFQAFPDWHVTRTRVFVSGNYAVTESIVTGTQLGQWGDIPATGNSVQVPALQVWQFAGNKVQRITEYLDMASVLIQLGVMPAPQWPPFTLSFDPLIPYTPTMAPPLDAAQEIISRWNSHCLITYYEAIRPDADIFMYPLGIPTDKDAFVASFEMYFAAFPDLHADFANLIDLGDGWVLGELVFKGTNNGEFLANAPTGRYGEVRGANLWHFDEEGLATNYYVYFDNISLLTQLGLFPPASSAENWEIYR